MDKQRQKFVEEINQLRTAVNSTESKYLKKDYLKAIHCGWISNIPDTYQENQIINKGD